MNSANFIRTTMYEKERAKTIKMIFSPFFLLSKIYGFVVNIRTSLYKKGILKSRGIDSFVISVGNIVVGGTGKTPTVIYIAELLKRNGYKVCVLCRGYKGTNTGRYLEVSNEAEVLSDPKTAGDEPYLLAKKLKGIPVIVGKNRYISGKYAVEKFSPDVCVMDDGFQHLKLKRDLDIVTFDGNVGFGNGELLPNGILREPLTALERADIILINKGVKKSKDIISTVMQYGSGHHAYFCGYDTVGLNSWRGEQEDITYLSGKRIVVFSAIANADYFYELITRLGGFICDQLEFRDHHHYNIDDYFTIVKKAHDSNADLVLTTEKDIIKLNRDWSETSTIRIFSLDVRLKPLGFDEMFEY